MHNVKFGQREGLIVAIAILVAVFVMLGGTSTKAGTFTFIGTSTPQVYEKQAPAFCNGTGTSTHCSATLAATPSPGDLLVFDVTGGSYSGSTITGVTGMTLLGCLGYYGAGSYTCSWYKYATTGDGATVTAALDGSGVNTEGILVDLGNASGTPSFTSSGSTAYSPVNKTITSSSTNVPAGGYQLVNFYFEGLTNGYIPSAVVNAPFKVNEFSVEQVSDPADYAWARAVFPTGNTSASATLFTPSFSTIDWNTSTATAVSTLVVSPGAALVAASPLPQPTAVAANQADSFVGSIGMNTHFTFLGTSNNTYLMTPAPNGNTMISALTTLGVRHIRDSYSTTGTTQFCPAYTTLYSDGIDALSNIGAVQGSANYTNSFWAATYTCMGSALWGFEGSNEPDISGVSGWEQTVYNAQQALYQTRGTSFPSGVKLLAAPFGQPTEANYALLAAITSGTGGSGAYSSYLDYGSVHAYISAGNNPEFMGTGPTDSYGASGALPTTLNWSQIVDSKTTSTTMITEIGWTTSTADAPTATDSTTQAKYILRGVLTPYALGVPRTYIYDLARENTSDAQFSIMDQYLNPSPAYTALENLISILKDPGSSFTTTPLSYAISALPDVRSLLFEKRDGSYWLVLWRGDTSFDTYEQAEIPVPTTTATIYFASMPSSLQTFVISPTTGSTTQTALALNTTISVQVTDTPMVLQIGTATGGEPTLATPQPPNCGGATPCP